MNTTEVERLHIAFKNAKGIVDHEFSQSVVNACEPKIQATIQRVINGETTFEAEEAKLLAQWKMLNTSH